MSDIPEDSFLVKGPSKIPARPEPEPPKPRPKNTRPIYVDAVEWAKWQQKAAVHGISVSEMLKRLVRRWKPK